MDSVIIPMEAKHQELCDYTHLALGIKGLATVGYVGQQRWGIREVNLVSKKHLGGLQKKKSSKKFHCQGEDLTEPISYSGHVPVTRMRALGD
jgi:hypothetical protein